MHTVNRGGHMLTVKGKPSHSFVWYTDSKDRRCKMTLTLTDKPRITLNGGEAPCDPEERERIIATRMKRHSSYCPVSRSTYAQCVFSCVVQGTEALESQ